MDRFLALLGSNLVLSLSKKCSTYFRIDHCSFPIDRPGPFKISFYSLSGDGTQEMGRIEIIGPQLKTPDSMRAYEKACRWHWDGLRFLIIADFMKGRAYLGRQTEYGVFAVYNNAIVNSVNVALAAYDYPIINCIPLEPLAITIDGATIHLDFESAINQIISEWGPVVEDSGVVLKHGPDFLKPPM